MSQQAQDGFKAAFRHYAAGVSVITASASDGQPVGFTATSLASLSSDPPMATFNMMRASSSWVAFEEAQYVAIHLVSVENRDLADRLAGPHEQRFGRTDWTPGPHRLPVFTGVNAVLIAEVAWRVVVTHNATIAVTVEDVLGLEAEAAPLLYFERAYGTLPQPQAQDQVARRVAEVVRPGVVVPA